MLINKGDIKMNGWLSIRVVYPRHDGSRAGKYDPPLFIDLRFKSTQYVKRINDCEHICYSPCCSVHLNRIHENNS